MKDAKRVRAKCCGAYVFLERIRRNGEDVFSYVDRQGAAHQCPRRDDVDELESVELGEFQIYRPRHVPTPPPSDGRGKYPWEWMDPGDHFLVECEPGEERGIAARLSSVGSHWCGRVRPDLVVRTHRLPGAVKVYLEQRPPEGS